MRSFLQGRVGLTAKLLLLSLAVLGILPSGCSQGGIVEGEVHYKIVTGMKDLLYVVIATNAPTDGAPSITVGDEVVEEEIKSCFPSEGNLVVDNSSEMQIERFYTRVYYVVSIHVTSGNNYKYYEACRTSREIFNELPMGARVKVETQHSDIGPSIIRIVE
jgi:hypothetical protein